VSDTDADDVTALLRAWHEGDEDAYRRVASLLYTARMLDSLYAGIRSSPCTLPQAIF
jgi:hypothetical protein